MNDLKVTVDRESFGLLRATPSEGEYVHVAQKKLINICVHIYTSSTDMSGQYRTEFFVEFLGLNLRTFPEESLAKNRLWRL